MIQLSLRQWRHQLYHLETQGGAEVVLVQVKMPISGMEDGDDRRDGAE